MSNTEQPIHGGGTASLGHRQHHRHAAGEHDVIDGLAQIWIRLTGGFPENHFGDRSAGQYISEFQALRFAWHRAVNEPRGVGTGGTIVSIEAGGGVMDDIANAIAETVQALGKWEGFNTAGWTKNWIEASNPQR